MSKRYFRTGNATRAYRVGGSEVTFEQLYMIGGTWIGAFVTEDAELADAIAEYGAPLHEVDKEEYEELLKKKLSSSGSYPDLQGRRVQASNTPPPPPQPPAAEANESGSEAPESDFESPDDLLGEADTPPDLEDAATDPESEAPEKPAKKPAKKSSRRSAKKKAATE